MKSPIDLNSVWTSAIGFFDSDTVWISGTEGDVESEADESVIALGSTYMSIKVTFKEFVTSNISNERVGILEVSYSKTIKIISLLTTTAT